MAKYSRIAFLFPGQGAQYPGMGKDIFASYAIVRQTLEEGDEILQRRLSKVLLEGPEEVLVNTTHSQPAIYLLSLAYTRLLRSLFPAVKPTFAAGLSLGEYTALAASGVLDEARTLEIVDKRGKFMAEACLNRPGTMAAVLGLSQAEVESLVKDALLPHDLWAANFNSPGQTVLSGSLKGVEKGIELARARGAKKVIPLTVQGAFHSGLMREAQDRLADVIHTADFKDSPVKIAMNASGNFASSLEEMKALLIAQVTQPVRWQECIGQLEKEGTDLFVEIGCSKTLSALNKRIGVKVPTLSFEKLEDLDLLAKEWS